jgi:hypothetical protein
MTKSISQIMKEHDTRVAQLKSEKATAKSLDEQWETVVKHKESKTLGRLSQILLSAHKICEMWCALKNGESLVLHQDGSMYKGHVNLEKLHKLQECFSAEKAEHVYAPSDPDTARAMLPLKFSANNNWDTTSRLADGTRVRKGKTVEPKLAADVV